ncbi:MAG: tetratricopeptide repeat protein [Ignavibacteriales bacterium]
MKLKLLAFIAAALLCFNGAVSGRQADSLQALANSKTGIEKIDALIRLSDYYQNVDPQKGLETATLALKLSENLNYTKGKADSYANIGVMYLNLANYRDALENQRRALEVRIASGNKHDIIKSYNSIGGTLENMGDFDKAMKHYYKAIETGEQIHDPKELSVSYSLVATLHYILRDYPKALEYCAKALAIREELNDRHGMANSYELMGLINYDFRKLDESLKYQLQALKMRLLLNERMGVAGCYQNLGMVYRLMLKYDLAIYYFNQALNLREKLGDKRGIAASHTSMGEAYNVLNKDQLALGHFQKAMEIRQEIKDLRGLARSYFHISTQYKKMGDYKNALEYLTLFHQYTDSLNNARSLEKLTALNLKYKTEKKDKEIELLQKENIIQKTVRNSLIAGFLLVTAIAVIIFVAYRAKKKTNLLLEEKNREISSQHEELTRLNEELKISNATKDKFFSIVAHDLRSPFFGFLGLSDDLAKHSEELSREDISEYAGIINQSARKIFGLLNNLLAWSVLQSGRMNPEFIRVDMHEEAENIINLFMTSARSKGVSIKNEVDLSSMALADKNMVETVLRNLVSNAIKFTGSGGSITISSKDKGRFVEMCVKDTGIGMDEETMEKIFRIDSAYSAKGTRGETGSGLGLILCRELISKNGGSVTVLSHPGKGTNFTFTLPVYKMEEVVS